MSLINDALKKAQKQRTGDGPDLTTMPAIGGESAARIARRDKPTGFNTLVLWIGLGATALVVLLVVGFFAVRWMTRPAEPQAKPAAPSPLTVAAKTPSTPTAGAPAIPTVSTTTANSPASTTAAVPAASSPTPVVLDAKPVVVVPVTPPPEPEPPKPVVPAPKMEPKSIAYIEALRVAGIRASTTDSKVLMNDRVYRTGDTVEHNLGLKLAVINASALTFEDEKGARYTRNF